MEASADDGGWVEFGGGGGVEVEFAEGSGAGLVDEEALGGRVHVLIVTSNNQISK